MKATLLSLYSFDVDDLTSWAPEADFGIHLRLMVGPEGEQGEESFDVQLCTVGWLAERVRSDRIIDGRHLLIVERYDYDQIERYLTERVAACEGSSWSEIGEKLGRLGHWEFEDYREYEGPDK